VWKLFVDGDRDHRILDKMLFGSTLLFGSPLRGFRGVGINDDCGVKIEWVIQIQRRIYLQTFRQRRAIMRTVLVRLTPVLAFALAALFHRRQSRGCSGKSEAPPGS
jgi:hypothetical protein